MRNTKIVKARCTKTGAAFGLEVKQFGSTWKVVDFVRLTDQQDAKLESQVDVGTTISVADNLLTCECCGSRQVGGCSCPTNQNRRCRKDDPYRYQCIFCKNLKLDYSAAAEARDGEQITLSQGQVITLTRRGVSINKLLVGMGWKPSTSGDNMDLDSSVFLVDHNDIVKETVYFGNKDDKAHSIHHHGDNLFGSEKSGNDRDRDDENISVDLSVVPQNIKALVFVVNIYQCTSRNQTLGDVRDIHIRLTESTSGQVLAKYNTFSSNRRATAMVIGVAYRTGSSWSFKALGECNNATSVSELGPVAQTICRRSLHQ